MYVVVYRAGILMDMKMADKFKYKPNNDTQNFPLLKLVVEIS